MLSWILQIVSVTAFSLRSIGQRAAASLAAVTGIMGVVVVFVGILSIGVGLRSTMAKTGDPETVMVMRSGATGEMMSVLTNDEVQPILSAPGIARGAAGVLASPEVFVVVDVPKRGVETNANAALRGVSPAAFEVRGDAFKLVEGRLFEPGKSEVIVGAGAAAELVGLQVGSSVVWGRNEWTIVGVFSTGGSAEDSEIWCDVKVLQPAYRRGNSFQSIHLRLENAAGLPELKETLMSDPRLNVMVERKSDWYGSQSRALAGVIMALGVVIGGLMGFGAVFGALNTMFTAVESRSREIATLRALGFGTMPVLVSVVAEALALAALGGAAGAAVAYFAFNGVQAATMNFQSFSQLTFAFRVTPPLVVGGLVYALAMGFVGGLLPALRAVRLPVATALREV